MFVGEYVTENVKHEL